MGSSVDRTLKIIDLLSRSAEPLGTSQVARRLRLPKSTVHGLLTGLADAGAVERLRQGYRLGPLLPRLAAAPALRRRWRPVLERLAAEVGETSFLGQPRGTRVAVLDEVLGTGAPIVSAPVGSWLPATAGAVGRVLAGARVAEDRGGYLEGVNAAAVRVPGGVLWVAGFASRFTSDKLSSVARLLQARAGEDFGADLDLSFPDREPPADSAPPASRVAAPY